jgi:membrane-anchored protein YejM (alkaline phosphatase superfamily)
VDKQCKSCYIEAEWQNRYNLAVKRFDKSIQKAMSITMIAVIVALICVIITAYLGMKVVKFMSDFEYVEETTYSIEQDRGINTAIIGEENEVNINGTEDN